eukprot:scaffold42457_cov68-Phaeocystis_antarctica.AAC.2
MSLLPILAPSPRSGVDSSRVASAAINVMSRRADLISLVRSKVDEASARKARPWRVDLGEVRGGLGEAPGLGKCGPGRGGLGEEAWARLRHQGRGGLGQLRQGRGGLGKWAFEAPREKLLERSSCSREAPLIGHSRSSLSGSSSDRASEKLALRGSWLF